ncbi:MAG: phosphoribosyl-ATP diphosphatase, partial [Vulcanococcus sp.]
RLPPGTAIALQRPVQIGPLQGNRYPVLQGLEPGERVIEGRRDQPEPGSYTNKLLEGGDNRILKKSGEESAEFVMACKDGDVSEIAGEAADILFHLQVALAHHGVSWRQVQQVLAQRRGAPRRA